MSNIIFLLFFALLGSYFLLPWCPIYRFIHKRQTIYDLNESYRFWKMALLLLVPPTLSLSDIPIYIYTPHGSFIVYSKDVGVHTQLSFEPYCERSIYKKRFWNHILYRTMFFKRTAHTSSSIIYTRLATTYNRSKWDKIIDMQLVRPSYSWLFRFIDEREGVQSIYTKEELERAITTSDAELRDGSVSGAVRYQHALDITYIKREICRLPFRSWMAIMSKASSQTSFPCLVYINV